jgi:hypothetical protein
MLPSFGHSEIKKAVEHPRPSHTKKPRADRLVCPRLWSPVNGHEHSRQTLRKKQKKLKKLSTLLIAVIDICLIHLLYMYNL